MKKLNISLGLNHKKRESPFSSPLYAIHLENTLEKLLEAKGAAYHRGELGSNLPLIAWEVKERTLSFTFISYQKPYLTRFLYDLLSRWIIPGKQIKIPLFLSSEFSIDGEENTIYSFIELVANFQNEEEEQFFLSSLPYLEKEVRLGAFSFFHASRLMEAKGLSLDEKALYIQEKISYLIARFSARFEDDLIARMQEFLVVSKDTFKAARSFDQLFRIVTTFYTFFKDLNRNKEDDPAQRHLFVKIKPTLLQTPVGIKKVLGVFVGNTFLRPNEVFEEKHLFKALRALMPNLQLVTGSSYIVKCRENETQNLYLEIEKEDQGGFSFNEMRQLKRGLLMEIKNFIEQLVSPVFMPRNEEEIMRNILTLSQQLKFVRDLPQVITSFEEQHDDELYFTLVMLRILLPSTLPINDLLASHNGPIKFIVDRIKQVGVIRKKYPKEASVLRVCLPSSAFLREDHTLDLYRARQAVLEELQKLVGEVRDYNGGMMSKQTEVLTQLKSLLGPKGEQHRLLLENFFYSLYPVELRSVLAPHTLKNFFTLFLSMSQEEESIKNRISWLEEEQAAYVCFSIQDLNIKERVFVSIEELGLTRSELVTFELTHFETRYIGYLYFSDDEKKRKIFLDQMEQSLTQVFYA